MARYQLLIFIGLPGAGKSTFYDRHCSDYWQLVSKDRMSANNREKKQRKQLTKLMEAGAPIVVDNGNILMAERKAILDIADQYSYSVAGVIFTAGLEDCLRRNASRARVVPAWVLQWRARNLQPPTVDEGFHRIFTVETRDGSFQYDEQLLSDVE